MSSGLGTSSARMQKTRQVESHMQGSGEKAFFRWLKSGLFVCFFCRLGFFSVEGENEILTPARVGYVSRINCSKLPREHEVPQSRYLTKKPPKTLVS